MLLAGDRLLLFDHVAHFVLRMLVYCFLLLVDLQKLSVSFIQNWLEMAGKYFLGLSRQARMQTLIT